MNSSEHRVVTFEATVNNAGEVVSIVAVSPTGTGPVGRPFALSEVLQAISGVMSRTSMRSGSASTAPSVLGLVIPVHVPANTWMVMRRGGAFCVLRSWRVSCKESVMRLKAMPGVIGRSRSTLSLAMSLLRIRSSDSRETDDSVVVEAPGLQTVICSVTASGVVAASRHPFAAIATEGSVQCIHRGIVGIRRLPGKPWYPTVRYEAMVRTCAAWNKRHVKDGAAEGRGDASGIVGGCVRGAGAVRGRTVGTELLHHRGPLGACLGAREPRLRDFLRGTRIDLHREKD
ncbi:MAG: hypothetical protein MUF00_10880 [Gemmatimonadaceae bacterium]|nr:hypothetical protein [Gemmatimonadaceae bacterium]